MRYQNADNKGIRILRLCGRYWALPLMVFALAIGSCVVDDGGIVPDDTVRTRTFRLTQFPTCDSLDDYLTDVFTETFTRSYVYESYYWGTRDGGAVIDAGTEAPSASGDDQNAAPDDYSTTNVQEVGVDEPDLTKTDGEYIYVVQNSTLYIVDSWPAEETNLVATLELAGYGDQMFLTGDRIVTFTTIFEGNGYGACGSLYGPCYADVEPGPTPDGRPEEPSVDAGVSEPGGGDPITENPVETFYGTRITVVDITDRTQPEVVVTYDIEGNYVSARMVDDIVYLATMGEIYGYDPALYNALQALDLPEIEWDATAEERAAFEPEVRSMVTPIVADWVATKGRAAIIPDIRVNGEEREDGFACGDIYAPGTETDLGMLTLVAFDPASPLAPEGVGLLANGWTTYASQDSYYIAQDSRWWMWLDNNEERWAETHVHRFDLNDGAPSYATSGSVPGWVLNQFSFSENDGYLRVATTNQAVGGWWWGVPEVGSAAVDDVDQPTTSTDTTATDVTTEPTVEEGSNIYVLAERGGDLEIVGSVTGIAPGERIFAVRFLGDTGYVVTFEQVDPLFTVDLSDPTAPQVLGELHITGASTYLHPVGETLLLSVGFEADEFGRREALQLQMFDVSDLTAPTRTHQEVIGTGGSGWSSSAAEHDHRAFTFWLPADRPAGDLLLGYLALPVTLEDWSYTSDEYRYFSGIIVYEVTEADGFVELGRVSHSGLAADAQCGDASDCRVESYFWYTAMQRSTFIEEYLYAISNVGLTTSELTDIGAPVATVPFLAP